MPSPNKQRHDGGSGEARSNQTIDTSTLPYSFNPPPHPSILHKVPDLTASSSGYAASVARIYDETSNEYAAGSQEKGGAFSSLRLGRIVMWDKVFSYALQKAGTQYGFRFLYNPTQLQGSVNVGTDFIPNPTDPIGGMLQSGLEQISFQLLINRMPEVQGNARAHDYKPLTVTPAEMEELRTRGTHYDVEFLYRVANGVQNTTFRKHTGDIGILLPNPCELHLGPYRSRGALFVISVTDQMYSADMVPMLSYVNVVFSRYLAFVPDKKTTEILKSTGVTIQGESSDTSDSGSSDSSSSSSSSSGGSASSGDTLTGGQVEKLARDAGFSAHDAHTATMVAWAESSWRPKAINYIPCYGLWQINMSSDLAPGRLKEYKISKSEELWDPQVNARAALKIFKGQGWDRGWTAYHSGKYKECPAWTSI